MLSVQDWLSDVVAHLVYGATVAGRSTTRL
jgi:hypothetical protein